MLISAPRRKRKEVGNFLLPLYFTISGKTIEAEQNLEFFVAKNQLALKKLIKELLKKLVKKLIKEFI